MPADSLQDLVAYTRKHPGRLNYGSGTCTFMLVAEAFKQSTGVDMVQIPFKGSGPAAQALAGGTVQVAFALPSDIVSLLASGHIRMLAVSGATRLRDVPSVPTFAELGLKEELPVWTAVFAPPGTPPEVIARTRLAVLSALSDPRVRGRLEALFVDVATSSPEALSARIAQDIERAKDIARRAGVVPY